MTRRRSLRRLAAATVAALAAAALPPARARADEPAPPRAPAERRVPVRVLEVAGGRAFVVPGADAGLAPGTVVQLRRRSYPVIEVSAGSAVIRIGDDAILEGDRGVAMAAPPSAAADERLPAPAPLAHFAGKWPAPAHPADAQTPRAVPLGRTSAGGPLELTLSAHVRATKERHEAGVGELALGTELTYEPWRERPFGVDADATAYAWWGPAGGPAGVSETTLRVRELRLRYGADADPYAAIGRLRWAARGVGLLDGARLRVPVTSGLSLVAFGGLVPDPVSDAPAADASRFGVAASWDGGARAARPHLDATLSGSIFEGALDERRLDVGGTLAPGPFALAASAEVAMFPADNPWGEHAVELVAAGADVLYRDHGVHVGAHLDTRQPERSRYLASLLPAGWLCETTPGAGAPEACDGARQRRTSGVVDAGLERGHLALSAGAQAIAPEGDEAAWLGGFADLRLLDLGDGWRVGIGGTVARSELVDLSAVRVELGGTFEGGRLASSVFYRVGTVSYLAALETFVQHRLGLGVDWTLTPDLALAFEVEGESGPDLKAVSGIATVVWRPFP